MPLHHAILAARLGALNTRHYMPRCFLLVRFQPVFTHAHLYLDRHF